MQKKQIDYYKDRDNKQVALQKQMSADQMETSKTAQEELTKRQLGHNRLQTLNYGITSGAQLAGQNLHGVYHYQMGLTKLSFSKMGQGTKSSSHRNSQSQHVKSR